jgi:hypothetical protein
MIKAVLQIAVHRIGHETDAVNGIKRMVQMTLPITETAVDQLSCMANYY